MLNNARIVMCLRTGRFASYTLLKENRISLTILTRHLADLWMDSIAGKSFLSSFRYRTQIFESVLNHLDGRTSVIRTARPALIGTGVEISFA